MDAKFDRDEDEEDSDLEENYLPTYRHRNKGGAEPDYKSAAPEDSGARLGSGAKGGDADDIDSDEEDDVEAPDAKATGGSAPSKPPTGGGVPPVAQSKATADDDDAFGDFGGAKSAAMLTGMAETQGKRSVEQRRTSLMRCCARGGDSAETHEMVQCFIVRDRSGTNYMAPVYRLYSEPPAGEDRSRAPLLASARKRVLKGSSNFLISLDHTPTDRSGDGIVGKLRGDWSGGAYTIFDHGLNPAKTQNKRLVRRELGLVQFEYDQMGPGTLRAVVPAVSSAGVMDVWQPETPAQSIAGAVSRGANERLLVLENKRPHWDEAQKGHVLNFKGRVTQSSVKNFQLRCEAVSGDLTVLQFGRVDKNLFTMDFAHPLCPLQAFALCLSVFDGKVTDYKDLETMLGGAKGSESKADEGESGYGASSRRVEGSMTGPKGLMGSLPSRQYIADKVRRFSS